MACGLGWLWFLFIRFGSDFGSDGGFGSFGFVVGGDGMASGSLRGKLLLIPLLFVGFGGGEGDSVGGSVGSAR